MKVNRGFVVLAVITLLVSAVALGLTAGRGFFHSAYAAELAREAGAQGARGEADFAMLAPAGGPALDPGLPGNAQAPDVPPGQVIAETHAKAASFDGDVRDLPQVGIPESAKRPALEMPSPFVGTGGTAVDPVAQTSAVTTLAMPATTTSFKGLDFTKWGAGWPPDTNGDVGPNHFIQTVNTAIGIYSKTGTSLAAFTFNTFFGGTNTPCDASNQGDPVVLYDQVSGRWVITDFAWTNTSRGPWYECIAVSKTADPVSGGYWMYAIPVTTGLNDYPKLGVWSDGIYMSANLFKSARTYAGTRVWALNRDDLTSGAALRSVSFTTGNSVFSLLPANARGVMPAAGTPEYFASISTGTLQLWKFKVNWTTPSSSTFTGPTTISGGASFTKPGGASVPQKGSTEKLDSLGDRAMVQLQYANVNGTESIWLTHTVVSGSTYGVRWYEVRNLAGTASVYQQGTYQPDSNYRFMPSLAVDKQGNMAVGYSVSSSTLYPAIRYAGRLVTDPLGTLGQGETSLIEGTGSQSGGYNRWGDYAAMNVDPADFCTFWFTTEYYETTGNAWQTRIGSFKYSGCN